MKNELIGKEFKVLDDGYVRLVDFFGSDDDVANAARVSYAKGTKTAQDNANLVRYLMRHEHFSPFAMCQVKLHVRLPIFVHNQWVRHDRFHWNVMSARYSIMPTEKWTTTDDWRAPSSSNKQAGDKPLDAASQASAKLKQDAAYNIAEDIYQDLLAMDVCREQARSVLPMGQYTECFVTANLGDWLLFLRRRMDSHAQKEIQAYANVIYEILRELFPVTMEAFMDYQYGSTSFSSTEMKILREIIVENVKILELSPADRVELLVKHGLKSKRERIEFIKKLK